MSELEILSTVEGLLTEFFLPQTTNKRKQDIEEILNNFKREEEMWKYCLMFIEKSNNIHVSMYALTTLQVSKTKKLKNIFTDTLWCFKYIRSF